MEHFPKARQYIQSVTVSNSYSYSGPFPHPDILQEYEKLLPGAAKTIFDNYLQNSNHIREIEKIDAEHDRMMDKTELLGSIATQKRGQWLGFSIAAITLLLGFIALMNGHPIAGTIFGGLSISSLVGVFVYRKMQDTRKEDNPSD